jgi:hypothetical protein
MQFFVFGASLNCKYLHFRLSWSVAQHKAFKKQEQSRRNFRASFENILYKILNYK